MDYILIDNVLEHLPMRDVPMVLYEIRRVLKPGGRCVIAVPDFTFIARSLILLEEGLGVFNPVVHRYFAEVVYGTQVHEGEYHRTPMTPKFLNYLLQMVGFTTYTMEMYPVNVVMPSNERFPGANPMNDTNIVMRNDMLFVDITK